MVKNNRSLSIKKEGVSTPPDGPTIVVGFNERLSVWNTNISSSVDYESQYQNMLLAKKAKSNFSVGKFVYEYKDLMYAEGIENGLKDADKVFVQGISGVNNKMIKLDYSRFQDLSVYTAAEGVGTEGILRSEFI